MIGGDPEKKVKRAYFQKVKVLALVDCDTGRSRAYVVDSLKASDLAPFVFYNVAPEARLMTDEAAHYDVLGRPPDRLARQARICPKSRAH